MMEFPELLALAKRKIGTKSDRELCRRIGVSEKVLPCYRDGTLPSDGTMLNLCLVSGVTPERGLLLLNIWRSSGQVNTTYRRIYKMWDEAGGKAYSKGNAGTAAEQIHIK